MGEPLRVVLVGWGAIGRTAARLVAESDGAVEIVGVAVRSPDIERNDIDVYFVRQ